MVDVHRVFSREVWRFQGFWTVFRKLSQAPSGMFLDDLCVCALSTVFGLCLPRQANTCGPAMLLSGRRE